MHIINTIERVISTCKNNFISGISVTDKLLPMQLWFGILDQAHITLNMIRPSRRNPKISVQEMMEGNFDFNKTPLAPPGTKFIVHENRTVLSDEERVNFVRPKRNRYFKNANKKQHKK